MWLLLGLASFTIACKQDLAQTPVPAKTVEKPPAPVAIATEADVIHCSWKHSSSQTTSQLKNEVYNSRPALPNWGIGFLVENPSQAFVSNTPVHNPGYEWLNRLCLPLHQSAQSPPWAVLTGKWVVDLSGSSAQFLEFEPNMVQTSYETYAFIILQETPEGWFQIQYAHPEGDRDGTAWVRKDHFQQQYPLVVQYWRDLFQPVDNAQTSNRGYLYKREQLSTSIPLKSTPSASSPTLFTLQSDLSGQDYGIEPLEIQGNWMRARISIPHDFCGTEETFKFYEDWIRWWSEDVGPILYYPPRGC